MSMRKYESDFTQTHEGDFVTVGALQPICTALDQRGIALTDMFLWGLNELMGSIVVADERRARNIAKALDGTYATTVAPFGPPSAADYDWVVRYSQLDQDGGAPSRCITNIVMEDGTVAMKDGYPTR